MGSYLFAALAFATLSSFTAEGSERLYFSVPLNPTPAAPAPAAPAPAAPAPLTFVPYICFQFGLFCPPGYSRPAAPGTPSTPRVPADLTQQVQAALTNGNNYRSQHGAPPLTLDPTLTDEAQKYAEYLASTGQFKHSTPGVPPYGENLALMSSGTIAAANTAWYGEKPLYCPTGASGVTAANGHFTQMVWKDSVKVGYGSAVGANGMTYIVARYFPAGNYVSNHAANVSC